MHHSLKIKILDLDHIESIVEQDITSVEAKKIVGGINFVKAKKIVGGINSVNVGIILKKEIVVGKVCADDDFYCLMNVDPMPDPGSPPSSNA